MRVHILSDIHLEFADFSTPHPEADLVVLAGDIGTGTKGLHWILQNFRDVPVVYVLGNHEFYGEVVPALLDELKLQCQGTNVHLLENGVFETNDIVVLGATLWTDFDLNGDRVLAQAVAAAGLTDFKIIKAARDFRPFRPTDARALHLQSRRWLEETITIFAGRKIVVVTHHAPSPRSIDTVYRGNLLNPCFASNLEPFIEQHQPALWVHGHLHSCSDYSIGKTRVLANPRGYPSENTRGFDPMLTVEV